MQECNATIPSIQPIAATDGKAIHALYLHVPFCFHKCHYCDFFSLVEPKGRPDRQAAFTKALIAELEHAKAHYRLAPQTLFIGGGTPTLLRPSLWEHLLSSIRRLGILDTVLEFTVEANPETVTPELANVLSRGGVNRVSMGAQSFNTQHLKTLERWHDPDTVPKAVACLREAGINNLNLDLIFAIPGQALDDLDRDLDLALSLDPTHLSCYSLIFEPNTPLTQKMKLGRISPVGEELERAMYERVMDRLENAGYEHYEISNWAKRVSGFASPHSDAVNHQSQPDTRCLHNLAYWHNHNWLGLGPSAASHINGKRWKNEPHLGRYIAQAPTPPTCDHEHLPERQRLGEQIMLGLRLRQGLPISWINEHIRNDDPRHAVIKELIDLGMLEYTPTHLRLTRQGLFLADSVIAKLL